MIHYHGGPITPEPLARRAWQRGHAFVSFRHPRQIEVAATFAQSFALDNGAFSIWRATGAVPDSWDDYYWWAGEWLAHPACDWAVIPDVIDGTEAENDELVDAWPHGHRGVPVWHLNESIDRLARLAADGWPRIALGSTQQYDVSSPAKCLPRLAEAVGAISTADGMPLVKLHGLRMLNPAITERVPLSSADSTNLAMNTKHDQAWRGSYSPASKETRIDVLRERIELAITPARMAPIDQQASLWEAS